MQLTFREPSKLADTLKMISNSEIYIYILILWKGKQPYVYVEPKKGYEKQEIQKKTLRNLCK